MPFAGLCPPKTTPEGARGVGLVAANQKSEDKEVSFLGHRAAGRLVESDGGQKVENIFHRDNKILNIISTVVTKQAFI